MGTLFRWRRFILGASIIAAIVSVVISLLLPVWYKASSRLLLPESGTGGLSSALLGDLSGAAASLLGTASGDYVRYLAILTSRTVSMEIIDKYDLVAVYETEESETPRSDAHDMLAENVEFIVDDEFNFLSIEVLDQDPERAASIANFYVESLNEVNNRLTSQTAGNFRKYVEGRFLETEQERSALLDSLAEFQREYGVFDLEAQTEAFFDQLASMRAEMVQAEIQYEALRSQFGEQNPTVMNLQEVVEAASSSYEAALSGSEAVLPVGLDAAPQMVRRYADLTMQRTIQEKILELVAPMLEQARFEEQRRQEALQILDVATPPVKKAKPVRSILVIISCFSAFVLIILFVLVFDWWQREHKVLVERLKQAAERP